MDTGQQQQQQHPTLLTPHCTTRPSGPTGRSQAVVALHWTVRRYVTFEISELRVLVIVRSLIISTR